MRRPLLCALGLALFVVEGHACGIERWSVKTLADPQGTELMAASPMNTTITVLVAIAPPDRKTLMGAEDTRFPEERHQIVLEALVIGFKKEADQDFHIVLAAPENPTVTMIAEIPSPDCVPEQYRNQFARLQARFVYDFGKPAAKFKKLAQPVRVSVQGVFFFDFIHGQTGVAKNGAELHPLLSWIKL